MMRIAVAGGMGLGPLIAQELDSAENAYNVILLSRQPRAFHDTGIQVITVDYADSDSLLFALEGVDLVISTVTGEPQIQLIYAAGQSQVRHFVPAEFEGLVDGRPTPDPLNPCWPRAKSLLKQFERSPHSRMKYTVFTCGIFMERFHPSGLGAFGFGPSSGVYSPGDYIINLNDRTAAYVERDRDGRTVRIAMTSIADVARFVAAAVDIGPANWPHEFKMYGDRKSVRDLVGECSRYLNVAFVHTRIEYANLSNYIRGYYQQGDTWSAAFYQRHLATANKRYDISAPNFNPGSFRPTRFSEWLQGVYPLTG